MKCKKQRIERTLFFLWQIPLILTALILTTVVVGQQALAQGRFSIGPFASVSSSKSIKPSADKASSSETVTQRTTYGLKVGIGLGRFFGLDLKAGVNDVDRTIKSSALRDEFGDIDFEKDANVNPNDQAGEYRYQESQKLATGKIIFQPRLFSILWFKAGAGVRARMREVAVTDSATSTKSKVTDPIRYHAIGSAGFKFRLLGSFSGSIEYDFYFLKFPELEPHEQEVSVSFGVSI